MLSGHSDWCPLWWKCPEFYLTVLGIFIRYVNAHLNVLNIRWTRTWKSIWLQTVLSFFISRRCVYWCQFHSGLCDDWQLHLAPVNQLHICYCLQGKTLKKCRFSMSLRMLQSGCYYLKWVLSQHLTKQFWMFEQGTFFIELLLGKKLAILPICDNGKKNSTVIACKRHRFDFWNWC